jgi:hypothetical protein
MKESDSGFHDLTQREDESDEDFGNRVYAYVANNCRWWCTKITWVFDEVDEVL